MLRKLENSKNETQTFREFFDMILTETGHNRHDRERILMEVDQIEPTERRQRRRRRRPQQVLPVKVPIDVNPILIADAVAEAASVLALYCLSQGILVDKKIDIGAGQVGTLWLATVMLARDMWASVKNEVPTQIEYPDVIAEFLQALRPCKKEKRFGEHSQFLQVVNYAGKTTEKFLGGSDSLYPNGFPLVPGRLSKASISWPTGMDSQNPLNTTIPNLTDQQLLEYGPIAVNEVLNELMPRGGLELVLVTEELPTKHSHAIFSNVKSAYYPGANAEDGVWGESGSEILVPNEFAWLSFLGMFEYDENRVTPFVTTNFIGMHGFFDRFQVGGNYRGGERVHFQPTEIPASQLLMADVGILVGADIDRSTAQFTSPIHNKGETITQDTDSMLYQCGGTDVLHYSLSAYSRYMKESWVMAFSFGADTQVLCGASFAPNNATIDTQIPFETAARLASLQPQDMDNRGNSCFANYCCLTAKGKLMLNPYDGNAGGQSPPNTLNKIVECLYPNVQNITYSWGDERGTYVLDYVDPFDYSTCYTRGENVEKVEVAVNDVWNSLQAQVNLGDANGYHESDRSLVYYRQFLTYNGAMSLINSQGFDMSVFQQMEFFASDLEILPEEVGADTMGILPIVYIDRSIVDESSLQYYRTIYRAYQEMVFTTEESKVLLEYLTCIYLRATYHTKWAAEQQEYSEALIHLVGRNGGGGRGFFKKAWEKTVSFGKKLIKEVAPLAGQLLDKYVGPGAGDIVQKVVEVLAPGEVGAKKLKEIASTYHLHRTAGVRKRKLLEKERLLAS